MELILVGFVFNGFILLGVWLGYKMGKGDALDLTRFKMKKAIRTEADERALEDKLSKQLKPMRG